MEIPLPMDSNGNLPSVPKHKPTLPNVQCNPDVLGATTSVQHNQGDMSKRSITVPKALDMYYKPKAIVH